MNYLWVSWGYFFFCLFAYTLVRRKKLILKISGILGCIITAIGFIQLFFTLFAVALISLSLVSDKEYTIHHRKDEYVVRRYVISFATLMNSTYTFVTYRSCKFLPFEKRLDKTSFVSPEETTLNFEDPSFQIEIGGEHAAEWISFSSIGESYKKELGKDGLEYIKESSPLEEKSIIRPSLPRPGRVPVW